MFFFYSIKKPERERKKTINWREHDGFSLLTCQYIKHISCQVTSLNIDMYFSDMTASNLVVPVVLWGRQAPIHCISTILMTPDTKHVITGCNDGQIIVWDVDGNMQVCNNLSSFWSKCLHVCLIV